MVDLVGVYGTFLTDSDHIIIHPLLDAWPPVPPVRYEGILYCGRPFFVGGGQGMASALGIHRRSSALPMYPLLL